LRRTFESPPVDDLCCEHHRRVKRDAAEALQTLDHGRDVREQGESFDLAIKLLTPLELVEKQCVVFAVDEPVVLLERAVLRRQMQQPL
jgi:hypothetical protein